LRSGSKWAAAISVDGRKRHIGNFDTAEAAAKAYDEEAKRLWTNPNLNFLPDGALNPDRHQYMCRSR
jgi:hypothetical protein